MLFSQAREAAHAFPILHRLEVTVYTQLSTWGRKSSMCLPYKPGCLSNALIHFGKHSLEQPPFLI